VENCPHCDAPLKPAARYCLACDRPLDESSRLSVAEFTVVKRGRPIVGLLVTAVVLVVFGGVAYGAMTFVHHQRDQSSTVVVDEVKKGTTLLVAAEGGQASACQQLPVLMAGVQKIIEKECAGLVGHDPGAKVSSVTVDQLKLDGRTGSAHVRASVSDSSGTHTIDRVIALDQGSSGWHLKWDSLKNI
jgi:hypothetical protein